MRRLVGRVGIEGRAGIAGIVDIIDIVVRRRQSAIGVGRRRRPRRRARSSELDEQRPLFGGERRLLVKPADDDVLGELTWKSTAVDERTRTLKFRADLPNPDGRLAGSTGQQ